ncbi:putative ring finger protein B (Protein rngB) [Schistosoma mansoni]|uniref:putative ring finger protein B (Protein rngB) n=1 Tax=Schistosoma mansoni TaxID=6183 RepID=UPI0001A63F43|nr:putative ring finger protein B (Protein rngB) [Schistosoma mansoni]|eukprot:XP_018654808.1 putative ring finger protein B (Protein rngB) [Schistosoma mansoni]
MSISRISYKCELVRQAPFAIEEDGFGTFQLQIEVAFLDCVTTFYYDLTLFDQNALHTYRTIQMDPAPEDWSKLIQLGGIAIPRTSTQSTVHEIVQTIQSYSDLESLHPFSFYPELEPTAKSVSKDKSTVHTNQIKAQNYQESDVYTNPKVLDYSSNYQTLHHEESFRKSPEKHNFLMDSNVRHSLPVSSSSSSDRLMINQHLPQKHKKKLQLLHEAQLLLEKAQQSRNWAPVISPPPPPVQPLITGTINSPEDSHIPSPNPSTWSSQLSPSRSSPHDPTDVLNHHQHHLSYENQKSPVAQFHGEPVVDPPFNRSPRSDSTRLVSTIGSSQDSSGPKQRIVLKLSRSSCGSQLSVSSSQPLEDESMERSERKKRKKESKKERRSKNLGSSPTKHSFESYNTTVVTTTTTTTNTTTVNILDKDIINTVANKSKQSVQIFPSETSPSLCKRNSPKKYSSHDTYSNDSSPELTYNSRKSTLNKNPKISSDNNNNNNLKTFVDTDEHDDLLKYNQRNSSKYSNQQCYQQYSSVNNTRQDTNDTYTSDIDSLSDSISRSTHSHLLLIDQKEDDYHDGSGRETPVVDYFGDEFQQQHSQKDQQHSNAFSSSTIRSSLIVRNVKYSDEMSINNQNLIQSIINNDASSNNRLDDSEEPLTHSVIRLNIPAVNHATLYENSPTIHKTKDNESKNMGKFKTIEKSSEQRQHSSNKMLPSDHEISKSMPVSGTHKYASKVVYPTENNKQNNNEQLIMREQSNRGSSNSSTSFNKVSNNSNNIAASTVSRNDKDFINTELSSLSSDSPCDSSSSSVTPPMLSDETFHLINVNEFEFDESRNGTVNNLKSSVIRPVVTSASLLSVRGSEPVVVQEKSDTNPTSKVISSDNNSNKLERCINPDHQVTSANVENDNSESTKPSDYNLEVLFDRLIRLREPHLAIRMSEILLYYISAKSLDPSERKNKSNLSLSNNNNNSSNFSKGVKVIHDNPKLIAFDLRKLPNSCIEKLTALIKEDEDIFRKHNLTTLSKSNDVKSSICNARRSVLTEDAGRNDNFHNPDRRYECSDHRDSSGSGDL